MSRISPEINPVFDYKISPQPKENSFRLYASKEAREKILKMLAGRSCFVESHNFILTNSYLELDHRALEMLHNEEQKNNLRTDFKFTDQISQEAENERKLADHLEREKYDYRQRIWHKDGKFHTKVGSDIYSAQQLNQMTSLVKGDHLIEGKKSLMSFNANPFEVFGVFNVAQDLINSNKNTFRYNFSQNSRKTKYEPLINDLTGFVPTIDGADDIATSLNNTGLPQQTVALLQGLLIFPVFLKGVHLGYSGLGAEAAETSDNFRKAQQRQIEMENNLKNFRREICETAGINHEEFEELSPQNQVRRIGRSLEKIRNNFTISAEDRDALLKKVTNMCNDYQHQLQKDVEAPEIRQVIGAYTGWFAMTGMMGAVAAYEAQAVTNIFGGVKGLSKAEAGKLPILSQVGNSLGFAGQALMTFYALHKAREEFAEWGEINEELKQLSQAKDVSDLASQITTKMLEAERNTHRTQFFGNMTLAAGQAMMAVSGPISLGMNPLLYGGLAATLAGVAVNSFSELKHEMSVGINEESDELEKQILKKEPQLTAIDFNNISDSLRQHGQRQIFAMEILGHLRAPQLVMQEDYLQKNDDQKGILGKAFAMMGGERIVRWMSTPPQDSLNLVRNNETLKNAEKHPDVLDMFTVEEKDLDFIWSLSEPLSQLHNKRNTLKPDTTLTLAKINEIRRQKFGEHVAEFKPKSENIDGIHKEIIEQIQEDFITQRSQEAALDNADYKPKTTKEICTKIIEHNGYGAVYLQKKILRAVANGDLTLEGITSDKTSIQKNGRNITVAKFDPEKLTEQDTKNLETFLTQKRYQKTVMPFSQYEKRTVLAKTHKEQHHKVKSDHLRPFTWIGKISSAMTKFFEGYEEDHTQRDPEKELLIKLDAMSREKKTETEQNAQIEDLTKGKEQYLLFGEPIVDKENKLTTFVYRHPHFPDSLDHEVTYIHNDATGTFNVLYGRKAQALIVDKANADQSALVATIKGGNVEVFGDTQNCRFRGFKQLSPTVATKPTSQYSQLLNNPLGRGIH